MSVALSEGVDEAKVIAKYGGICYLCLRPIDATLPRGGNGKPPAHLLSLNLDHILPSAHGRSHVEWNLAPTHRHCNTTKGGMVSFSMVRRAIQWQVLCAYGLDVYQQVAPAIATAVREAVFS